MPDDRPLLQPVFDRMWLKALGWIVLVTILVVLNPWICLPCKVYMVCVVENPCPSNAPSGGTTDPNAPVDGTTDPNASTGGTTDPNGSTGGTTPVTITLASNASTAPAWLLLHTPAFPSSCLRNSVQTFATGEIKVDRPPEACMTQRAIFADGFAPSLVQQPDWNATAPITLEPRIAVRVRAVGLYPDASIEFDAGLKRANELYDKNRMGMTFVAVGPLQPPGTPDLRQRIIDAQLTGKDCGAAIVTEASLFDNTSKDLYIFYIGSVDWKFGSDFGRTCVDDHPNVIFVRQQAKATLLAHEIGHSMGLDHSESSMQKSWGSGTQPWKNNVMYSSAFAPGTLGDVEFFTLGQAYRANFDTASWLNKSGLRSGDDSECGDTLTEDGPCPYIQLAW